TVTWSSTGTGGSFATPTSTTNASGIATVSFTTSAIAGTQHTVVATTGSITGTSPTITTIAPVAPPTHYIVTTNASTVVAGAPVTVSAQLADASNNPVATAGISVRWSNTGIGGSFATPTSTTDANGIATVVFTTGTTAGLAYTFTATDASTRTGTGGSVTT